jgi:hypothetical protein
MNSTTGDTYAAVMKKRGLELETVPLPHDTEGYWLGNKNAKNVIIYYHGTFYPNLRRVRGKFPPAILLQPYPQYIPPSYTHPDPGKLTNPYRRRLRHGRNTRALRILA